MGSECPNKLVVSLPLLPARLSLWNTLHEHLTRPDILMVRLLYTSLENVFSTRMYLKKFQTFYSSSGKYMVCFDKCFCLSNHPCRSLRFSIKKNSILIDINCWQRKKTQICFLLFKTYLATIKSFKQNKSNYSCDDLFTIYHHKKMRK